MSILQEYEQIRKEIGEEKWESIGTYLSDHSELRLDEVLYNPKNYIKFENWFYETVEQKTVELENNWESNFSDEDVVVNAILYQDNNAVADIITSFSYQETRYPYQESTPELDEEYFKDKVKNLIYDDFDSLSKLPKISECSKLLQDIYDSVKESDATMCHIDYDDWDKFWNEDFTEEDVQNLKEEVKKLGLDSVITFDDDGYKIIGWGDLESSFNDDRHLKNYSKDISSSKNDEIDL